MAAPIELVLLPGLFDLALDESEDSMVRRGMKPERQCELRVHV